MSLKINTRQVPPEGGKWEGDGTASSFGLTKAEGVSALGPVLYCLEGGISQGGFFATGSLKLQVQLQCVSCLCFFEYWVCIPDFAVQIELDGRESVDLTPLIREDILLALPSYPRCDFHSGESCPRTFPSEAKPIESEGTFGWEPLKKIKP